MALTGKQLEEFARLIGSAFSENRILAAAHALEGAIGFDPVPPAMRSAG